MTITIRDLRKADIEPIMALCEEHFCAVNMEGRLDSLNMEDSMNTLGTMVDNEEVKTLIAIDDDEYVGIISFARSASLWDYDHKKTVEILWYAKSPRLFINLFKVMENWITEIGSSVHIGIPVDQTVKKFLEKRGYKLTEYILSKQVGGIKDV